MAHQSDNARRLRLQEYKGIRSMTDLSSLGDARPAVYLLVFPYGRTLADAIKSQYTWEAIEALTRSIHQDSTIAILTTPPDAASLWLHLQPHLRFQLWVAIKLHETIGISNHLPQQHAALLILTKYQESLRHSKTRIAYTYCPACQKTTKDYGGKKHTYHEYGTLMSDVWRDITYIPDNFPNELCSRLQDLFGIDPYDSLYVIDLKDTIELKPRTVRPAKTWETPVNSGTPQTGLMKGDCLDVLGTIPSDSVDFCFADPPYNLDKKYDSWKDTLDIAEYFEWCDRWLTELARVLRPGRTCAILNIPQWTIRHFAHLQKILEYQSWIVWEGLSLPVRMIMPAHYSIVCFSKGLPRPLPGLEGGVIHSDLEHDSLSPLAEGFCLRAICIEKRRMCRTTDTSPVTDLWWDIHRLKHNSRRVDHPCQLPPALMRRLITLFTYKGECVLDPFNGAGTTTLVSEQLERDFIGIELSEKYHALAERRHEELRGGFDPFRKTDGVPNAKNSRVKRLKKQPYAVSKKALQMEIKRIAGKLGHLPSKDEVVNHSIYPLEYYEKYFINWGEVCAAARTTGMSEYRTGEHHARDSNWLPLFSPSVQYNR